MGCCEPNQSSLRMSDQHTPLGLHSQPAPKLASVRQGAEGRCGCVLMCLWVQISVDGYIPKQMRVCLGLCCLLPARLNTPTLFPHELCSPEWVKHQPQLLCLVRMLRLPVAQRCSGGPLSEILIYSTWHILGTHWTVCIMTKSSNSCLGACAPADRSGSSVVSDWVPVYACSCLSPCLYVAFCVPGTVSFRIAVTKHPDRGNLRENGFTVTHSSRYSPLWWGSQGSRSSKHLFIMHSQ